MGRNRLDDYASRLRLQYSTLSGCLFSLSRFQLRVFLFSSAKHYTGMNLQSIVSPKRNRLVQFLSRTIIGNSVMEIGIGNLYIDDQVFGKLNNFNKF